jgi:hypothetical protein
MCEVGVLLVLELGYVVPCVGNLADEKFNAFMSLPFQPYRSGWLQTKRY